MGVFCVLSSELDIDTAVTFSDDLDCKHIGKTGAALSDVFDLSPRNTGLVGTVCIRKICDTIFNNKDVGYRIFFGGGNPTEVIGCVHAEGIFTDGHAIDGYDYGISLLPECEYKCKRYQCNDKDRGNNDYIPFMLFDRFVQILPPFFEIVDLFLLL